MSKYGTTANIIQAEWDTPFYTDASCLTQQCLQKICDVIGDNWFIRTFAEGDNVDYYKNSSELVTVTNPENVRVLSCSKYDWGVLICKVNNIIKFELINLTTGENNGFYEAYSYTGNTAAINIFSVYNLSPTLKVIAFDTESKATMALTIMKDEIVGKEHLGALFPNATEIYSSTYYYLKFASLDSEGTYDTDKALTPSIANDSAYDDNMMALIRYTARTDDGILASIGDVMYPIIFNTSSAQKVVVTVNGIKYMKLPTAPYNRQVFYRANIGV